MPNTINGVGVPLFSVLETSNAFIESFTFPRTNINGLTDESTKEKRPLTQLHTSNKLRYLPSTRFR